MRLRPFRAITALAFAGLALLAVTFAAPSGAAAQETVPVDAGDFYFCSPSFQGAVCDTTIDAGDTVTWTVSAGTHTVTECDDTFTTCPPAGGFNSGTLNQGQQFSRTFDTAGVFEYHCAFHPIQMRGRVAVLAAQATPTPSPAATGTPAASPAAPAATASPSPAAIPATGGPPAGGDSASWAMVVLAGFLAASGAGALGVVALRRRAR